VLVGKNCGEGVDPSRDDGVPPLGGVTVVLAEEVAASDAGEVGESEGDEETVPTLSHPPAPPVLVGEDVERNSGEGVKRRTGEAEEVSEENNKLFSGVGV